MKRFSAIIFSCFLCFSLAFSAEESSSNILKNWSFEDGLSSWTVPGWIKNSLTPELDSRISLDASSSLSFTAENSKNIFVMQSVKRNSDTHEYLVSVWVRTENNVNFTPYITLETVSLENGREKYNDFHIPVTLFAADKWTKVEKKIEISASTESLRFILRSYSDPSKPSSGKIWFDCCQLEELVSKSDKIAIKDIVPGGSNGIFRKGDTPFLSISLMNSFAEERTVEIEMLVHDYYGKIVCQRIHKLNLPSLSVTKKIIAFSPLIGEGFYSVAAAVKIDGVPQASDTGSFVVTVPIETPDPFFGICSYCLPLDSISSVRLMGCGSAGLIIPWRNEYAEGKFNWKNTDARVKCFRDEGMKIIGQFNLMGDHYSQPDWILRMIKEKKKQALSPYSEAYYKKMAAFEAAAVERYKNDIAEWSAINEIDLSMYKDPYEKEHYIRAVKELYKVIKCVNPESDFSALGVSGCDGQKNPRFPASTMLMEELYKSLDGMAFDAYVDPKTYGPGHNPPGPERGNLKEILIQAVKLADKYGKKLIAIDEKGDKIVSSLPVDSIYAKQMAEALVRSYVIARSVPENRHWLYFIFKGAQEGNADYGLWRSNCPRPTVAAYATVARRLAYVSAPLQIDLNRDVYCFVFAKKQGSVTAIWTINEEPVTFDIDIPSDSSLYDIMNNLRSLAKGRQQLVLSKSPLFIESSALPRNMADSMKSASFSLPELKGEIRLKSLSSISVALANNSNKEHSVELIAPCKKSLTLAPDSIEKFDLNILDGNFDDVNCKVVDVEVVDDGVRKYLFSIKPELMKVAKINMPVEIDGDLAEFRDIKPIILNNPSFLFPSDALPNKLWTGPQDLSCKIYLAYDQENFYFAAEVVDDVNVNERGGFRMWSNDSFQIAFDTMNDALSEDLSKSMGYDSNDYEFGVGLTPKGPECFCYAAALENKMLDNRTTPFKVMVRKSENGNMIYELAIPWTALAPLKPVPGTAFGLNFINLDSDEPGKANLYGMGLSPGIVDGKNPHEFKTFILMP